MTEHMSGRWIMVSRMPSVGTAEILTTALALELASRHQVLVWDVSSPSIKETKTFQDLAPYRKMFSKTFLRNFLSRPSLSMQTLQGPLINEPEIQKETLSLLKSAFDYLLVLAPPSWDPDYLRLLDQAQAVFLIGAAEAGLSELRHYLDELSRHKYPRALGQVILTPARPIPPEGLAECQKTLDHPVLAVVDKIAFKEHIRALAQLLDERTDLYQWPRELEVQSTSTVRQDP